MCQHTKSLGSYDVTSVWMVLWELLCCFKRLEFIWEPAFTWDPALNRGFTVVACVQHWTTMLAQVFRNLH